MTRASGYAPGKIILFGEHAVVYGKPAIAVPVHAVSSHATLESTRARRGLEIFAENLDRRYRLSTADEDDPLALITRLSLNNVDRAEPDALLTVRSTVPLASGMGSGASVSAAICKAIMSFFDREIVPSVVSELVYEVEKVHHGTPSGIDNTVICLDVPVYYVKNSPPRSLEVARAFDLIIADTGVASPTKMAVSKVRVIYDANSQFVTDTFNKIEDIVKKAAVALTEGRIELLGPLMNQNQELLRRLAVSSQELESLIDASRRAGALGAKLSGGGLGGNIISVAPVGAEEQVMTTLRNAGAKHVWTTSIEKVG